MQIFKLSQGEYIVPQRIEGAYKQCPLLEQVYIHGDSARSFLVAVVVPEAAILPAAHDEGFQGEYLDVLGQPGIKKWLLEQMNLQAEEAGLKVGMASQKRSRLSGGCTPTDIQLAWSRDLAEVLGKPQDLRF